MLIPTRKPDPQPSWSRGGDGGALSPPVEPLHFCPRVKGVLWENIPPALPQPASTLNSPEKHSSSPALAFTGISWGAFLKPCPSPRRTPWGCIPAALSLFLSPHLPPSPLLPFSGSRLPPQSSISAINSTDRIRDTRQSIPMRSLSALQWLRLKCMERCYTSGRREGDNGRHWSRWHVTSFSFSLSVGRGRHAARICLDFIQSVLSQSFCETCVLLQSRDSHDIIRPRINMWGAECICAYLVQVIHSNTLMRYQLGGGKPSC